MSNSNEYMRQYMLARYHQKRSAAISDLGGKCVDCGTTERLEFDHKDPKEKAIDLGRSWSMKAEKVAAEIQKCELRCRNCHQKRSAQQQSVEHGKGLTGKKNCRCELCNPLKNAYARRTRKPRVKEKPTDL